MAFLGLTAADAALGAAGLQAGGSLLGGMLGASGASATNAQSAQAAQANLAQQENYNTDMFNRQVELSNTAYQRAMADMKAAGLNPILAANTGGASTPSALGINPPMPSFQNPGALMGAGIASAGQAGQVYQAMKVQGAQIEKDSSQADLNTSTGKLNEAQATNVQAQNANIGKEGDRIIADTEARRASARAADAAASASSASSALDATRAITEAQRAEQERIRTEQFRVQGAPKQSEVGRTGQDLGGIVSSVIDSAYKALSGPGGTHSVAPHSAKSSNIPTYSGPTHVPYQ